MEKTGALLLVLLLAVSVRTSWADDVAEEAKDAAQGVAEKAESWADWAFDKMGLNKESDANVNANIKVMKEATDKVSGGAKSAVDKTSKKMNDAKDAIGDAKNTVKDTAEEAKKKTKYTVKMAKDVGAAI